MSDDERRHLDERAFSARLADALRDGGFEVAAQVPLTYKLVRDDYDAEHAFRSLYQAYLLRDPDDAGIVIRQSVADLSRSLDAARQDRVAMDLESALALLYPMIKRDVDIDSAGEEILKRSLSYGEGLSVVYVIDLPTAWRQVDAALACDWGLDPEAVHARALENLTRLTQSQGHGPTVLPGPAPILVYHLGDGFDAARLLILDRLHPEAAGFIFTFPVRDQLMVIPRAELPEPVIAALRIQAEQEHHSLDHPLSPEVWQWLPDEGEPEVVD